MVHHTAHPLRVILEQTGLAVTTLAEKADVDKAGLSRVKEGKARLSRKMLEKLLALPEIGDRLKDELVVAYAKDMVPEQARSRVVIVRPPSDDDGSNGRVREATGEYNAGDALAVAIESLRQRAQANPALAQALMNLANVVEGQVSPTR